MNNSGAITVGAEEYEWHHFMSAEFSLLWTSATWGAELELLRIKSPAQAFDVLVRVDTYQYSDGAQKGLGPVLVLGAALLDNAKSNVANSLIGLRPKITKLKASEPNSETVMRIIQWLKSSHFRIYRINSSGGQWVGYGTNV